MSQDKLNDLQPSDVPSQDNGHSKAHPQPPDPNQNIPRHLVIELKGDKGTVNINDVFKEVIKTICTSDCSYAELEDLGIEDILVDKDDPAGIVYKIVVASWEGKGGL